MQGLTAQCIIPPVIKDEAIRKHAMPYTPGYNPTNTLQGMLQAKAEAQSKLAAQNNQHKQAPQPTVHNEMDDKSDQPRAAPQA